MAYNAIFTDTSAKLEYEYCACPRAGPQHAVLLIPYILAGHDNT